MATKEWREKNKDKMREYRREWYRKNKEKAKQKVVERKLDIRDWYKTYKSTLKCERCPENHPACLQFYHVDDNKEFSVRRALEDGYSIERILKEIEKCIVLCANCHAKEHWSEKYDDYL